MRHKFHEKMKFKGIIQYPILDLGLSHVPIVYDNDEIVDGELLKSFARWRKEQHGV